MRLSATLHLQALRVGGVQVASRDPSGPRGSLKQEEMLLLHPSLQAHLSHGAGSSSSFPVLHPVPGWGTGQKGDLPPAATLSSCSPPTTLTATGHSHHPRGPKSPRSPRLQPPDPRRYPTQREGRMLPSPSPASIATPTPLSHRTREKMSQKPPISGQQPPWPCGQSPEPQRSPARTRRADIATVRAALASTSCTSSGKIAENS